MEGANIVTTDVWTSMDSEHNTKSRKKLFKDFYVDEESMLEAAEGAIFLHCLPAHRGEEISFTMLDHSSSKVWDQAENRMHIQQSILESLIQN